MLRIQELSTRDIVRKAPFRKSRETTVRVALDANQEYIVIAASFKPGVVGDFVLIAYYDDDAAAADANSDVTLQPLTEKTDNRWLGEWRGASAGGCMNEPSWPMNPHYLLYVSDTKPTPLTAVLAQRVPVSADEESLEAIGFYVTKSDGFYPSISGVHDIVGKADFEKNRDVSLDLVLPPSTLPYAITPTTFSPGHESQFTLQVFTRCPVLLVPNTRAIAEKEEDDRRKALQQRHGLDHLPSMDARPVLSYDTPDIAEIFAAQPEASDLDSDDDDDHDNDQGDDDRDTTSVEASASASVDYSASAATSTASEPQDQEPLVAATVEAELQQAKPPSPPPTATPQLATPQAPSPAPAPAPAPAAEDSAVVATPVAAPPAPAAPMAKAPPPPPPPPALAAPKSKKNADSTKQSKSSSSSSSGGGTSISDILQQGKKLKKTEPITKPKTQGRDSMLEQIRSGKQLKSAAARQLSAPPPPKFSFTPFNLEKIVARRAAIEMSDEEDDQTWDDDDW
jgi:hypothetical protein